MPDIKISEVARLTGLSMRYWQRRALRGLECPSYAWQAELQNNIRRCMDVHRVRVSDASGISHPSRKPRLWIGRLCGQSENLRCPCPIPQWQQIAGLVVLF